MKLQIARIYPIVAAAMALLWSGCTGSDTEPVADASGSITFGPAVVESPAAGGRSMLLSTLADGEQMKVYGYCVPRRINNTGEPSPAQSVLRWVNKANYSVPDVFNGVPLIVEGGRPTYSGSPVPWYTSGDTDPDMSAVNTDNCRYSFMSYYPADGSFTYELNNAEGNNTTGAPRFIFRMPEAAKSDHMATPDAMVAAKFDHLRTDGRVDLTYSHILTALRFQINNYSSDKMLHIHSLRLTGTFFKEAKFDFNEGTVKQTTTDLAAASYAGAWDLLTAQMDVEKNSGRPLGDGTNGTSILLLPNPAITPGPEIDCLGSNKKITISYSLGDGEERTTETDLKVLFKPVAGVSYALNLNFVGDEFVIYFNPADIWEQGSDNDIEID